jgi:cytoskeleton protein RodZ
MSEAGVTEGLGTESADLVSAGAEPVTPAESSTPGSVLRQARESRGQSITDISQVIRFSARQIEALERDDYAALPGSTAVRGMVRSYAKLLKLDSAPLLAQIEPAVPVPKADVRPPANMGEAEQSGIVERTPPKWIAAGATLLVLVLAGYWYASLPGDGPTLRLRDEAGSSGAVTPNPVAASSVVPVLAPVPAVVAGNEPVSIAVAGVTASPPPFVGLRAEFDERSWIEIRDATQKVVFVGEYPAGTRQNVEGKAPFQIWIGKASGVRLFMGERSIDLKPHTREEIARFTLE